MSGWVSVDLKRPCPICGKSDWCTITENGAWAICRRIDSGRGKQRRAILFPALVFGNQFYGRQFHRLCQFAVGQHIECRYDIHRDLGVVGRWFIGRWRRQQRWRRLVILGDSSHPFILPLRFTQK